MNENTFLKVGNGNGASQPMGNSNMGMNPMGGDASSMPMGGGPNAMGGDPSMGMDQNMGGDPNAMGGDPSMGMDQNMGGDPNAMGGDPSMQGNDPIMGANPFGDTENDSGMSSDPEKKVESLAGQIASIMRKDLNGDGIDKHEDKKKEVLGMVASAVIDGMDDEQRQGIIDYLGDKLNGKGESDGDEDKGSQDDSMKWNEDDDMNQMDGGMPMDDDQSMGGDPSMGMDQQQQGMQSIMESIINGIIRERINPSNKDGRNKSAGNDKGEHIRKSHNPYKW